MEIDFGMEFMEYCHKQYSNYSIQLCKVPMYLSYFIPKDQNILLIYNKYNQKNDITLKRSNSIDSISSTENEKIADLTGSPLKLDSDETIPDGDSAIINYWLDEEETHYPVDIYESRGILNMYGILPRTLDIEGLFIICDQNDASKAAILGSSSSDTFLSSHRLTFEGIHRRSEKCLNIQSFLQKHNSWIDKCKDSKTQIEVASIFELFGSLAFNESSDSHGVVKLEISWNQLSYEIPQNASATVIIQCTVGHSSSESIMLMTHLELLQKYVNIIKDYESETDVHALINIVLPSNTENKLNIGIDLFEQINDVFQQLEEITQLRRMAQNNTNDSNSLCSGINTVRKNLDFTDLLWKILTECSTYSELVECFNYIFSRIIRNNIKPYVSEDNNTRIAVLIRNVQKGLAIVENLIGLQPIEMLIEIGIEKLRKDYRYIFSCRNLPIDEYFDLNSIETTNIDYNIVNNKRATLLPNARKSTLFTSRKSIYLTEKSRTDLKLFSSSHKTNISSMDEKITKIAQIHTVLEILLLAEISLNKISNTTFFNLATDALKYFTNEKSPIVSFNELQIYSVQKFQAKIPINEINTDKKENIWKLTITTETKHSGVKAIFLQSKNTIFPPSIYAPSITSILRRSSVSEEVLYHCAEYVHTWHKFGHL